MRAAACSARAAAARAGAPLRPAAAAHVRCVSSSTTYSTEQALRVLERHFSPAVPRAPKGNNMVAAHAKGSWITDIHGKRYLDLQTGIGVSSTGHSHPKCVRLQLAAAAEIAAIYGNRRQRHRSGAPCSAHAHTAPQRLGAEETSTRPAHAARSLPFPPLALALPSPRAGWPQPWRIR
jgi:hypothetical protein